MALRNIPTWWQPSETQPRLQQASCRKAHVRHPQLQQFQQEPEHLPSTYPAVFLAYSVQRADCFYLISLIAKYKLQWDIRLERDIRHPRYCLAAGSLLASVSSDSLIPLPGQQQLWHWWTAGLRFICFHLAQSFVPISSTLGGYNNWSRDHHETPSITTINTTQLFLCTQSLWQRKILIRDLKEHEEAASLETSACNNDS